MALEAYIPPVWTIDLALPPRDRYRQLARHYKDQVHDLTGLYDALLRDIQVPEVWIPRINKLSRLLLRKVYDNSQTEELSGISEESGVPMYLLVAFNVILDLLMGCTSGGVRSLEKGQPLSQSKMLHFRTLDWTMDPLRKVVVQLNFVDSLSAEPEEVLARSITYVGFTGVLTGVRPGLSMSLNFRGLHDNSTKMAQFRFYLHHLLVLLGHRPSIASYLRGYLTGSHEEAHQRRRLWSKSTSPQPDPRIPSDLVSIFNDVSKHHTTAAYLIFSDGDSTISVDKDFRTSRLRQSPDFIATTNHDAKDHEVEQKENVVAAKAIQSAARHAAGLDEFLVESEDRLECITSRWKRHVDRKRRERTRNGDKSSATGLASPITITQKQAIGWVSKYPTTNECTHYAVVMDPKPGNIVWCLAYPEPLQQV